MQLYIVSISITVEKSLKNTQKLNNQKKRLKKTKEIFNFHQFNGKLLRFYLTEPVFIAFSFIHV